MAALRQEKSHPEVAKTAKAVRRLPTNNKKIFS
jgi:hypothetical protein